MGDGRTGGRGGEEGLGRSSVEDGGGGRGNDAAPRGWWEKMGRGSEGVEEVRATEKRNVYSTVWNLVVGASRSFEGCAGRPNTCATRHIYKHTHIHTAGSI